MRTPDDARYNPIVGDQYVGSSGIRYTVVRYSRDNVVVAFGGQERMWSRISWRSGCGAWVPYCEPSASPEPSRESAPGEFPVVKATRVNTDEPFSDNELGVLVRYDGVICPAHKEIYRKVITCDGPVFVREGTYEEVLGVPGDLADAFLNFALTCVDNP